MRDGILNHSKSDIDVLGEGWTNVSTIEGQVVKISDIIAYVNHDIADAIRARLITEDELPDSVVKILGNSSSERINTLVSDIVSYSLTALSISKQENPEIGMSPQILEAANSLRDFLFERVYNPSLTTTETENAKRVIRSLYRYFLKHEEKLPKEYALRQDSIERKVADYVAGMTDQYALHTAKQISC